MPWSASGNDRRRVALWLIALLCTGAVVALGRVDLQRSIAVHLLPADDPVVRLDAEIQQRFGMRNPIAWIVVARDGEIWNRDSLTHVQTLTRQVLRIPGVIATDVISIASPNVRDVDSSDDSMSATYLMPRVPADAAEMQRLRRRVEGNPSFAGTLISADNRAAMVVADFRTDADPLPLAAAALDLRDRDDGAHDQTYVVGGPVQRRRAAAAAPGVAAAVAALLVIAVAMLCVRAGRSASPPLAAAILALLWGLALLAATRTLVLPWALYAALPSALVAAALAATPPPRSRRNAPAAAIVALFIGAAVLAPPPLRDFAVATAAGLAAAVAAASAVAGFPPVAQPRPSGAIWRRAALLLGLVALAGWLRLDGAFGAFGYGLRYLPRDAGRDLAVMARHFPPPAALALLARGEPGFVKSPDVLALFERLTERAAADPAVQRATSLADLLVLVHRAFSGDPQIAALPDDTAMIGRYLTLGYSPGFRHFVDRAFAQSVVWVYANSDDPRALARIERALAAVVASHPVPGVSIAVAGGDGAIALRQARAFLMTAIALAVVLFAAAATVAIVEGAGAGLRFAAASGFATLYAGGLLGLLGVPVDLVSAAAVIAAALVAPFLAHATTTGLREALLATATAAALLSLASGSQLGCVLAAALAAPVLAAEITPAPARRR